MSTLLPEGCKIIDLKSIPDERGVLTELYKSDWVPSGVHIQWNLVRSNPGTLRGVHLHCKRTDYLIVIEGQMWLGLYDMRRNSPTFQASALVSLNARDNKTVFIPEGVAHGFYFLEPTTTLYGLSEYWSMEDEMGCHPCDLQLNLAWPEGEKILSERDKAAGTLHEMQLQFDAWVEANGAV